MKEYQCQDCMHRFYDPATVGIGMLGCPECKSQVIFPVAEEKTIKRAGRKKRGKQLGLPGL